MLVHVWTVCRTGYFESTVQGKCEESEGSPPPEHMDTLKDSHRRVYSQLSAHWEAQHL